MSIVERIQQNDAELKELRLNDDTVAYCADMSELTDALIANSVIEYIRLDRDFLPSMQLEDTKPFFAAMSKLPALKQAQIWHASVHVQILADFVTAAKALEHLQLGCLELEGSEEDFALVSEALKGHPTLKSFSMCDFSLNNDSISVDGLVSTLATIPNLTVVKLEVSHSRRRSIVGSEAAAKKVKVSLSGSALADLCSSKTLEELYLNRLDLNLDDFTSLASAIKSAPALRVLALPHCNFDDVACIRMAEAIGASATLEKIDLSCNKLTDEGCVTLASALKGNGSVKYLRLWGNVKISNGGFDAVREMLEQNCVLERIPLMAPFDRETRIDPKNVERKQSQANAA